MDMTKGATTRQYWARQRAKREWKQGLEEAGRPEPTDAECIAFTSGFNMGWAAQLRFPRVQKSV